ncbi:uncharacterized protein XM38_046200 [Halomicronema hongdechloris C2206]|uniref:Transposase n=1 Tax=Halomicronema hongdechloris C2206 TaxID=1641165 RepID=A0A1Z3HTK1_9CYAN|nr:hypothetical protein [Halomicronema hongdechloris]ASC73648.1 uncharacterized protein XM38_046200 [Halomicronema hongdechloris C2206]
MAPKKLSEADKQAILELYRQPAETTSTLAEQFGVSNSTISRLLKSQLPAKEYGNLIQQKRSASDKGGSTSSEVTTATSEPATEDAASSTGTEPSPTADSASQKPLPKRRRRSRLAETADGDEDNGTQLSLSPAKAAAPESQETKSTAAVKPKLAELEVDPADDYMIAAVLGEDADLSSDDDYDDEDDELEDDFDEDDGDDWDAGKDTDKPHLQGMALVEINPLTQATLPKPCYLVVDRLSELITCPLKDFGELGQIPEAEVNARTLPVFDNHRVARRFSRRNQRVIKVPDGSMLQKTQPYLQSKGITRLLVDGQVYSLT